MLLLDSNLKTVKKAAAEIGVQYRQLLDAVNNGVVPHYKLGKSRMLVSVQEVVAIMKTPAVGGDND